MKKRIYIFQTFRLNKFIFNSFGNAICVRFFFLHQVMCELQNMKGSQQDKMKMLKFLQKQQDQQEKEEDLGQLESRDHELSQRLEGIHMDDFDGVWERLTEHERFVFEERVRTGNIDFIERWKPWWTSHGKYVSLPSRYTALERPCMDVVMTSKR